MAKCVHCGARKGKRRCPALGGEICSSCCGEHRRLTIACPDDCVWLGGGQLSLAPAPGASVGERIVALREKILGFGRRHGRMFRDAIDTFTSDGDVSVQEDNVPGLFAFAMYGYRDAQGKRCIDRFRESEARRLRTDELEVLGWLESARFRLLEIREVRLDEGFAVHDLLRGEDLFIHEKRATHQLVRFDVLASWVTEIASRHELEGAGSRVPRQALDMVLERARIVLSATGVPSHVAESRVPIVVHEEVDELLLEQADNPPILHNTHGELVVVSEARYEAADQAAVKRALAAHPELRDDGEGQYGWIDEAYNKQLDGPTLLGRVHVDEKGVRLETNSRERHARGRALLERALGELIRHRADSFSDPQQAARSARPAPAEDSPEVREVLGNFLQSKIMEWVDESIPALGGKTPRAAAKDPALRARVVALVKDYENQMERSGPEGVRLDFSGVWRELGLTPG